MVLGVSTSLHLWLFSLNDSVFLVFLPVCVSVCVCLCDCLCVSV